MGAVATAWVVLAEPEKEALATLANAAAVYVRALGASTSFPTLFASSSGDTVATWERAYDSAIATVNGPSIGVVAGQSGGGSSAPPWDVVVAALAPGQRGPAQQLASAHQAIAAGGGLLSHSLSDAPLREWLYLRAGRDAGTTAPPTVTTPVVRPSSGGMGTVAKIALGAIILSSLRKGRR